MWKYDFKYWKIITLKLVYVCLFKGFLEKDLQNQNVSYVKYNTIHFTGI